MLIIYFIIFIKECCAFSDVYNRVTKDCRRFITRCGANDNTTDFVVVERTGDLSFAWSLEVCPDFVNSSTVI